MSLRRLAMMVALSAAAATALAAEPLVVKPGLWEVRADGVSALLSSLPQLLAKQLSPEQQTKLQQRLAAAAVAGGVARICVTPAMLQRTSGSAYSSRGCTVTPEGGGGASRSFALACTGKHPATGTADVQAIDPETVVGTAHGQVAMSDGSTLPLQESVQAHWLGADCRGVKPLG